MTSECVTLNRKLLDSPWYKDVPAKTIFIHLLLSANAAKTTWQTQTIERGQYRGTLSELSKDTGLTVKQVRTALERLASAGEITVIGSRLCSVVTVCRFESFFAAPPPPPKQEEFVLEFTEPPKPKKQKPPPPPPQEKPEKKAKPKPEPAQQPEPPPPLDCDEFKAKWSEYETYRRERKLAKLQPRSVQTLWKRLAEWGALDAIASIEQTIANGYQGLFPPKNEYRHSKPKPTVRNGSDWL